SDRRLRSWKLVGSCVLSSNTSFRITSSLFLQYNLFECMIGGACIMISRESINGRSTITTIDERGRVARVGTNQLRCQARVYRRTGVPDVGRQPRPWPHR